MIIYHDLWKMAMPPATLYPDWPSNCSSRACPAWQELSPSRRWPATGWISIPWHEPMTNPKSSKRFTCTMRSSGNLGMARMAHEIPNDPNVYRFRQPPLRQLVPWAAKRCPSGVTNSQNVDLSFQSSIWECSWEFRSAEVHSHPPVNIQEAMEIPGFPYEMIYN